jgi:hypothetical protein
VIQPFLGKDDNSRLIYSIACNHAWDGKEKVITAQENMAANKLFTNIN